MIKIGKGTLRSITKILLVILVTLGVHQVVQAEENMNFGYPTLPHILEPDDGNQKDDDNYPVEDVPPLKIYPEGIETRAPGPLYSGLTLDSTNVQVYKPTDQSTWLAQDYAHYMDFSKISLSAVSNTSAAKVAVADDGDGNGYRFYGFTAKRGTGYQNINTDIDFKVSNVSYSGQKIDMVFTISQVTLKNYADDGAAGSTAKATEADFQKIVTEGKTGINRDGGTKGVHINNDIHFKKVNGIYCWEINMLAPVTAIQYTISYYKAGTTTPVTLKVPHVYGDQEGGDVTNGKFTGYPNEVANYNYGEYIKFFDAKGNAKYPKFMFTAANATKYAGTGYIPDLKANAQFEVGVWKTTINSDPKTYEILKNYGYKKDGVWDFSHMNINSFEPIQAQWTYLFNGSVTNKQENGYYKDADRTLFGKGVWVPSDSRGFTNQIGYVSVYPSTPLAPEKWVSDKDETLVKADTLADSQEPFSYTLEGHFPIQYYDDFNMKAWKLTDSIPAGLTVDTAGITAYVYDDAGIKGKETKGKFTITQSGQTLTLAAKAELLADLATYGANASVRFNIPVKITNLSLLTRDSNGKILITNNVTQSGTYFNDQTFSMKSNDVTTRVTTEDALSISKTVDKTSLETGGNDPAAKSGDSAQTLTYKVAVTNNSKVNPLDKVSVLDVLPIDGDSRGTKLAHKGKITAITLLDQTGKAVSGASLWYTSSLGSADITKDPNSLTWNNPGTGWSKWDWGSLPSGLASASAILVNIDSLPLKATYSLSISIDYTGDNVGGVLSNTAMANSSINHKLASNQVESKIYGRSLTGRVWKDSNRNGLYDQGEQLQANVPVKLYRTSLVNTSYSQRLVTASLDGQSFVNSKGDSLVKTDSQGQYTFKNLPEGSYDTEFQVDTSHYVMTTKLVDTPSADDRNSKVQGTRITDIPQANSVWQKQGALLSALSTAQGLSGQEQVLAYNDMGLVDLSAHLKLFKYQNGTLIDTDHDGSYSSEELASAKGLPGATFQIYKGHINQLPTAGKADSNYIGEYTTDSKGEIKVDANLYAINDYTVFETVAPNGYELVKSPIYFTVKEANETIVLPISDDQKARLPNTGQSGYAKLLLIAITGIVVGLSSLVSLLYFRLKRAT